MKAALTFFCLSLLLVAGSMPARASEPVAQVLKDQRANGYQSAKAAIARLHHASDAPGPEASLAIRLPYERALLGLALESGELEQVKSSLSALQLMDAQQSCKPCRFLALIAQSRLALNEVSADAARAYLDQAAPTLPDIHDSMTRELWFTVLANNESQYRNVNLAVEYTMQALQLAEARADAASAIRLQSSLVRLNTDLGDLNRAVAQGEEAYARAKAMNFLPVMALISLDLGHTYALTGDKARQRAAIERTLELSRDNPEMLNLQILSLNNLSDAYLSEPGKENIVLGYARRADTLARENGREIHRAPPLTNIGIALAHLGKVDEGITYIRQALAISEQKGVTEYTVGITHELVGVLEQAGRYREALAELHKFVALESDLTRQQRESAVLELQERYDAQSKNQRIIQLSAQNALRQAELATETWRNRLWVAVALILGLGSVLLLQSIRRARQTNRSLAIANASLAEQSTTDPLTGASNRRHAQILLDRLRNISHRRRSNAGDNEEPGTGLLLLDLDFFKHVNDSYGHAAGDAVLIAVTQRLRQLLRQDDTVARWGGEEFVLVLPHTPTHALPAIARTVLHAIADTPVTHGEQDINVTVSLGAVCFPMLPTQDWEAALAVADLALYQAKAGGRNRAVCLTHVDPFIDIEQLSHDLTQSQQTGEIILTTVSGPTPPSFTPPPPHDLNRTSAAQVTA